MSRWEDVFVHFILNNYMKISTVLETWATVISQSPDNNNRIRYHLAESPTSGTSRSGIANTPQEVLEVYKQQFDFAFVEATHGHDLPVRLYINEPGKMVPESPKATIRVDPRYFKPGVVRDHDIAKAVDDLVDLAVTMHTGIDPLYTYGLGPDGPFTHPTHEDLGRGRVRAEAIHWLNVLPESLVTKLGRDRVLETPAWQVTELDTGDVLLVAYENPVRPDDDLATPPDEIESVVTHLGLE